MALSVLISAWLVGAMGGAHCLAMCGGFVGAAGARDAGMQPLLSARAIAIRSAAYHAGRVATYTALGAAFGAAGALALDAIDLVPVQRALHLVANLFLLALGISIALRASGVAWLQRAGATAFASAMPALRPLLARPGPVGRIALGLVWGLMPCALVYSVLPLSLFAGGAAQGGAVMLAFGLGTMPNLVASGIVLDRIARRGKGSTMRYLCAALVSAFAIAGIARAITSAELPLSTAFCLVP